MQPELRRRLIRLSSVLLVGVAVTIAAWMITGDAGDNDARASVASLFVGLTALLIGVIDFFRSAQALPKDPKLLADDLAVTVNKQWLQEARARSLRDPRVLPVVWEHWVGDGAPPARFRARGSSEQAFEEITARMAAAYRTVSGGRLVMLGEPGAGKTAVAVLLTLGLLRVREPGDAVAVLLPAAAWDPVQQSWHDWLVTTVADLYYSGDRRIAELLADDSRLIPVVDGLDEIPEVARRAATRQINAGLGAHQPVVLTCRLAEYDDALRSGAPSLLRAPVVVIQPVSADDLAEYLAGEDWPARCQWGPVLERVRADPDGPVAQAMSTPLMISAARMVYLRSPYGPQELLDTRRFRTRQQVEDRLVDMVTGAAFARRDASGRESPWPAAKARQWLTFLAGYLHRHGERDLRWWQLSGRLLTGWSAPAVGVLFGLLVFAVSAGLASPPQQPEPVQDADPVVAYFVPVLVALVVAVLATLLWFAGTGARPGQMTATMRGLPRRLAIGFRSGFGVVAAMTVPIATCAAVAVLARGGGVSFDEIGEAVGVVAFSVGISVVAALGSGVHALFNGAAALSRSTSPRGQVRADRRSALAGAVAAGITVAVLDLPVVAGFSAVGEMTGALASDWFGLPGVLPVSPPAGDDAVVLGVHVVFGAVFAGLILLTRAWFRFVVVRAVLAARGRLPWRLMAFLDEAHRRDLLRESGGVYQFRHIRLQERLAERAGRRAQEAGGDRPGRGALRYKLVGAAAAVLLLAGVGAWNTANSFVECRKASAIGDPEQKVREFGTDSSVCYGLLGDSEWDRLGPPRPEGTSNDGEQVFDAIQAANQKAPADAVSVAVRFHADELTDVFRYTVFLHQLAGMAVAQAEPSTRVRIVLVDVGHDEDTIAATSALIGRWRSRQRLSTVLTVTDPSFEDQSDLVINNVVKPVPVLLRNSPSRSWSTSADEGTSFDAVSGSNESGTRELISGEDAAVIAYVRGEEEEEEEEWPFSIYSWPNAASNLMWGMAGREACLASGQTLSVYTGTSADVLDFLSGARECTAPPPMMLSSRLAAARVMQQPAKDFIGWTFYFASPRSVSPGQQCTAMDQGFLRRYQQMFPNMYNGCDPLLSSAAVAHQTIRSVQAAATGTTDQPTMDAYLWGAHVPQPTEVVRIQTAADGRTWVLDRIST